MPYETPPFMRYATRPPSACCPTFGAGGGPGLRRRPARRPLLRTPVDLEAYIGSHRPSSQFRITARRQPTRYVALLEQGLTGDWPTPEIAARLSVSVHHLGRLLREEDTTVSDLRRDLMRDTATNSLVIGKESIDELSARPQVLRAPAPSGRRFADGQGMPPGAYRPR
ncbi:MAG: hypothetical protein IPH29_11335 [Candidatus Microthrix sp.]|nr:hypothetical protein [Candidatus Microthrix sp.]